MFKKRENVVEIEEGNFLSPKFDNDGLIPVITMCSKTKDILMHGYMNVEAFNKTIETKELKLRPGTGDHDYQVKIKNAQKFLKEGNRVKFSLRFKGREMEHSNLGIDMLKRVKSDLEELIRVEMEPKIEGRQAFLVVAPK